jgi:hypothetical protein
MKERLYQIDATMLRAIFTKPARVDRRPVLVRLLASLQPAIRVGRKGLTFLGLRGRVEF